jgi:transposase
MRSRCSAARDADGRRGDPELRLAVGAINAVAQKLGIGTAETVRKWVRQAEVDTGQRPGATSGESAELKRLRRENAELRRANETLKAASASS